MKLVERPMGEALETHERKKLYEAIVGGVSWPCRRKGYAIVLGYGRESGYEPFRIVALDEYTDFDLKDVVTCLFGKPV